MFIRSFPLFAGIAPFTAVTLAYWLGVDGGSLPSCNPYLEGCTSISSTGRHEPGSFLFKAAHMPQAMVLVVVWYFSVAWLQALNPAFSKDLATSILICGVVGAFALILYTTFLGTKEPVYEFMRRFGIYLYFLGTSLSQLLVALPLRRIARERHVPVFTRTAAAMLWVCLLPFALGILNLVLKAVLEDAGRFENQIEWIAALLMQAYFVLLYVAWKKTGFNASVSIRK